MAIVIGSDNSGNSDLPWFKDWAKGKENTRTRVVRVNIGDRGILMETPDCKAFLFRKSTLCTLIGQTIPLWCAGSYQPYPLYLVKVDGAMQVILEDDEPATTWTGAEGKYWELQATAKSKAELLATNPFLIKPASLTMGESTPTSNPSTKRATK